MHRCYKFMLFFNEYNILKTLQIKNSFQIQKSHTLFRIWLLLSFLENSSDCQNLSVVRLRNNNSCFLVGGMDNLPVADVQSHMS